MSQIPQCPSAEPLYTSWRCDRSVVYCRQTLRSGTSHWVDSYAHVPGTCEDAHEGGALLQERNSI